MSVTTTKTRAFKNSNCLCTHHVRHAFTRKDETGVNEAVQVSRVLVQPPAPLRWFGVRVRPAVQHHVQAVPKVGDDAPQAVQVERVLCSPRNVPTHTTTQQSATAFTRARQTHVDARGCGLLTPLQLPQAPNCHAHALSHASPFPLPTAAPLPCPHTPGNVSETSETASNPSRSRRRGRARLLPPTATRRPDAPMYDWSTSHRKWFPRAEHSH